MRCNGQGCEVTTRVHVTRVCKKNNAIVVVHFYALSICIPHENALFHSVVDALSFSMQLILLLHVFVVMAISSSE